MVRNVVKVLVLCAMCGWSVACGADDDDAAGSGGGAVGGLPAGTGGAPVAGGMVMAGSSGAAGTTAGSSGGAGMAGAAGSAGSMSMFVPGSPTWGAVYQEILVDTGCSGGPLCHGGTGAAAGGLGMSDKDMTYDLLMKDAAAMTLPPSMAPHCKDSGKKRVVPGDPANSLLVEKIEKAMPICGQGMPPGGKLTDAQIAQIKMWIMMGAKKE